MNSFTIWLIKENLETLKSYQPNINIINNNQIPNNITEKIYQLIQNKPENEQIPYSQYLLGFYLTKKEARNEDYQRAIDNYTFYRNNKQLYPNIKGQPFELGKRNLEIQTIKDNNFSKNRMKKLGKIDNNENRLITEKFGKYTFYTIPKANNKLEIANNKYLYCKYGKGTDWCTASPDGTYYLDYADKLDITIIYLDNKPLYQFGLNNGNIDKDCQFMDVKDIPVYYIKLDLYNILLNSNYKNILKLSQLDNMENILDLNLDNEKTQLYLVKEDPYIIQIFDNPSEQVKLEAVKQNGYAIKYIQNPPEKIQLEAVKQNGHAIKFIQNPTEQVKLEAVKQYGDYIQYIKNPSEQLQLEAVKQSGFSIQYIQNPTKQVQLEAVKQNPYYIQYIKNPIEQVQLEAVKQSGFAIQYINNPSETLQLEAVKQNGNAIQFIQNPTEQVKLEAVKNNGLAIEYIQNPSKQVQLEAVKQNDYALEYIKNPSEQVLNYLKNLNKNS